MDDDDSEIVAFFIIIGVLILAAAYSLNNYVNDCDKARLSPEYAAGHADYPNSTLYDSLRIQLDDVFLYNISDPASKYCWGYENAMLENKYNSQEQAKEKARNDLANRMSQNG